jgi:Flp pilus assembly protein TadG
MFARRRNPGSRRGAIVVLAAILMTFLMVMVAFAVDFGRLCSVQTQAQAVADAAALAGAKGLTVGPAQVLANAQACAQANTVNGQAVVLQSSDVVLGTWNPATRTFTALTGSAQSGANSVQVTVNLTAARGDPVSLFLGSVIGMATENVTASAIAAGNRWDVVIAQDITDSYSADLSSAVNGHQLLLADFNQYSPSSNLGVAQHTGWGSTWASLQPVGANFSSLKTTIGKLADCSNNTTSAYNVYGGTTTSIAVTTQTPACSGSDLATGIQQAINMFNSAAYTSTAPAGVGKAIILSSDGESNASSNGQHPSSKYTDTQLNTLAQTTAANAWAQGISVFVVFYYHGSDSGADTTLLQSLVQGHGTFTQVADPTQVPTALDTLFRGSLTYGLVQ